jgi:voltage-gated potassium channel
MTLEQWERRTEWPLTVLSLIFFVLYAWQILAQPTGMWNKAADWAMNGMWALFAADYLVGLVLAKDRWAYIKSHVLDLAVCVLPMIRPLRLLRVLTALNALHRTGGMALRGRIAVYVTGSVTMILLIGSLSVLDAERHAAGSNIRSFGDAIWWAFTTITTVGYGDRYPVTTTGRVIAVLLMIGGIAMLGIVTGSLASWIVDMISAEDQKSNQITRQQIEDVARSLEDITTTLRTLQKDTQKAALNHNNERKP